MCFALLNCKIKPPPYMLLNLLIWETITTAWKNFLKTVQNCGAGRGLLLCCCSFYQPVRTGCQNKPGAGPGSADDQLVGAGRHAAAVVALLPLVMYRCST